MKKLNDDVVGITDAEGNRIASYSYDEWGKLLSIETTEENNAEQLAVAEMNPFRYRGYYYDNETGMYYLQSRYYNPDLCRFISADDFSYLDTTSKLNANAYIYCWNCPVVFDDIEGTTPKLSINLADIIAFIQNINQRIKDGITAGINKLTEKLSNLVDKWKYSIKTHYNAFIDKVEYALNYPDAIINKALSKVFNKDVNIRFRLVEYIREKTNLSIDLSKLKTDVEEEETASEKSKSYSKKRKYVSEAGKAIGVIITEIFTCLDLQYIAKELKVTFDFDDLKDYMQKKADLYKKWFDDAKNLWTASTRFAKDISGYISLIADFIPVWQVKTAFTLLPYATSALSDFSGRYLSPKGGLIMLAYDWSVNLATGVLGKNVSGGDPILEIVMNVVFGKVFDIFSTESAEYHAYNWYLIW